MIYETYQYSKSVYLRMEYGIPNRLDALDRDPTSQKLHMIWHAKGGLPIVELDELTKPQVIPYKKN